MSDSTLPFAAVLERANAIIANSADSASAIVDGGALVDGAVTTATTATATTTTTTTSGAVAVDDALAGPIVGATTVDNDPMAIDAATTATMTTTTTTTTTTIKRPMTPLEEAQAVLVALSPKLLAHRQPVRRRRRRFFLSKYVVAKLINLRISLCILSD